MKTKFEEIEIINDIEVSAKRILNAPRELVWKVWTEPEHIANWWGPSGFTNTIDKMEVKQGGKWEFIMHGPDGIDYPNIISYIEVKKPELLVYNHGDKEEDTFFHVTVKFEELGNKTRLNWNSVFKSAEQLKKVVDEHNALEGLKQNIDKLEKYLENL
ncbi:MAG: SRPBCC domain-containing protein [Ignavibacteriae bacterium]|nr:SRPBCC domain-containing protein [Ignavibacteriota bacterium]